MEENRRKRTRVPVHFDVTITMGDKQTRITTSNISLTGILCATDPSFKKDAPCEITIILNEETRIHIPSATVIRTGPKETAISFSSITEEGFYHLRKLLQYNTDDADLIDQEMHQPAFK